MIPEVLMFCSQGLSRSLPSYISENASNASLSSVRICHLYQCSDAFWNWNSSTCEFQVYILLLSIGRRIKDVSAANAIVVTTSPLSGPFQSKFMSKKWNRDVSMCRKVTWKVAHTSDTTQWHECNNLSRLHKEQQSMNQSCPQILLLHQKTLFTPSRLRLRCVPFSLSMWGKYAWEWSSYLPWSTLRQSQYRIPVNPPATSIVLRDGSS